MTAIITGRDAVLARWAATLIPYIRTPERFGRCHAVGIATGNKPTDRLMAAVVFFNHDLDAGVCQIGVASADPRWCHRGIIGAVLAVPFIDMDCRKVWCMIPHINDRTIGLAKAVGFRREGCLRDQFGRNKHAEVYRMLKPDYERHYDGRPVTRDEARPATNEQREAA